MTIITVHRNAKAAPDAPVVSVSDLELAVSQLPGLRAWWRPDVMFRPSPVDGVWVDRVNDIPLTLWRSAWPVLMQGGQGGQPYLQFTRTNGTILASPADEA